MRSRLIAIALVLVSTPAGVAGAQLPSLRPTPATFSTAMAISRESRPATHLLAPTRRQMGPTTKGLVIGGAAGLVLSTLATVLYVESTDPGNYSGAVVPIVIGATALGAVVGAAVGAGAESRSLGTDSAEEGATRATDSSGRAKRSNDSPPR